MIGLCTLWAVAFFQQGARPAPRSPQPSVTNQESTQTNKQKAATGKQAPNGSPTVSKPNPAANTTNQNTQTVERPTNEGSVRVTSLPRVAVERDVPTFLISIILAVVGFVGIIVAIRTVKAFKHQTRVLQRQNVSMKLAAIATARSADALIASERAWVMVDLEKIPGVGTVSGIENGVRHDSIFVRVRCVCTNQGKTPAWIIEKRACLLVVTPTATFPSEPDLNIDLQDASVHYLQNVPSKHDWTLGVEGTEAIGSILVIYGVVKYRHLFSEREVQTTFGYRVTADGRFERLTEHHKYNQNT